MFDYKKRPEEFKDLKICLDGIQILQVEHTKFLGIYIDEKLNWLKHVTHISQKISTSVGIISRAKKILPFCLL